MRMNCGWRLMLLMLMLTLAGGCALPTIPPIGSTGGSLDLRSAFDPDITLKGRFDTAVYSYGTDNSVRMLLVEGPIDSPRKAAMIRLMWRPKAAQTPIDSDATNATIQLAVFSPSERAQETEVGLYSGAGFLFMNQPAGDRRVRASIWQATLALSDASADFQDTLGESELTGSIIFRHDPLAVQQLSQRLSSHLSQELGYPRLIELPSQSPLATR